MNIKSEKILAFIVLIVILFVTTNLLIKKIETFTINKSNLQINTDYDLLKEMRTKSKANLKNIEDDYNESQNKIVDNKEALYEFINVFKFTNEIGIEVIDFNINREKLNEEYEKLELISKYRGEYKSINKLLNKIYDIDKFKNIKSLILSSKNTTKEDNVELSITIELITRENKR